MGPYTAGPTGAATGNGKGFPRPDAVLHVVRSSEAPRSFSRSHSRDKTCSCPRDGPEGRLRRAGPPVFPSRSLEVGTSSGKSGLSAHPEYQSVWCLVVRTSPNISKSPPRSCGLAGWPIQGGRQGTSLPSCLPPLVLRRDRNVASPRRRWAPTCRGPKLVPARSAPRCCAPPGGYFM